MASRLRAIREYWRATADTCQKLVAPKQEPPALAIQYAIRHQEEEKLESAEFVYERACILASDMNLPFKWAEAIVKLRTIRKPQAIPQSSWLDMKSACAQLYMNDFTLLKVIVNNGWSLEDVYGCNKLAPLVRVDCMGLSLLLHQGDEVVEVNKERIQILRRSGKVNYLYKRFHRQMKVSLLYEL